MKWLVKLFNLFRRKPMTLHEKLLRLSVAESSRHLRP